MIEWGIEMADTSVVNFKSPKEFIDYYSSTLKSELEVYDLQINKLGFVGFLLNILGHTNFDAKQYYDSLFKESFVATAQETENLYFHSATYGYLPTFATPSNAFGNIVFDFALLPKLPTGVIRREAVIGDDASIIFENEGYSFITDSKYKFIQSSNGYSTIITSNEGNVKQLPSATAEVVAPFQNVQQFKTQEFFLTLPNYNFGTYYPYVIEIDEGHISDIRVWIKRKDDAIDLIEQYRVSYVKYFEESFSKTVFLRKLTSRKFVIEFGSGIRGAYIPASEVTVEVDVTMGVSGNLVKEVFVGPKNYIAITNYYDASQSNKIESLPAQNAEKFVKVNFKYSKDGANPLSGDLLRNDVVAHIQSYDMLVSQRDFYNIAEKYLNDFRFLFKKSVVSSNTFYLCRSFRDKYQIVSATTNHSLMKINYLSEVQNIALSTISGGVVKAENITYKVVPSDQFTVGEEVEIAIDLTGIDNIITEEYTFELDLNQVICTDQLAWDAVSIGDFIYPTGGDHTTALEILSKDDTGGIYTLTLSSEYIGGNYTGTIQIYNPTSVSIVWDAVDNANEYIVYKYNGTDYLFTKVDTNSIIDDGTGFVFCNYPLNYNISFFPKFMINGQLMVSPFLYYYNSFMEWYDGFLFYDSFTVYFSEAKNTGLSYYDIPVLYFLIEYDYIKRTSYVKLKSHQDISGYEFEITISERSIYRESLVSIDNTEFVFEYTDTDGVFWDEFHIELFGRKGIDHSFESSTHIISQVYDIKDELNILLYDHNVYVGIVLDHTDPYIINVPLIGYDTYMDDPTYYLDKIKQFIVDNNVKGKRMISDNLQFRFLDSLTANAYFLENFTVQKYNTFDIVLPLKLQITIIINSDMVVNKKINIAEKKAQFMLMTADWLQTIHTGTEITFYNSQVVDLIHTDQEWIKSVSVVLTDSLDTEIQNGLETISDEKGLMNISDDKLGIVTYTPHFWFWDIDNIDFKITI